MRTRWLSLFCAGVALAIGDAAFVFGRGFSLFLSSAERILYAFASTSVLALMVLAVGALLAPALGTSPRAARVRVVHALAAGGYGFWLAVVLTSGRRVHDWSLRSLVAFAAAFACAALLSALVRLIDRVRGRSGYALAAALIAFGVGALVVDVHVLPRGYPPFHGALFATSLLCAALSGLCWPAPTYALRAPRPWALGLALSAVFALVRVAEHPNVGFIVREHGPYSRKLVGLIPVRHDTQQSSATATALPSAADASVARLDLRDRDTLLITVDALRADMLRAYGGRGLTPNMDALAAEGVVFKRAYTPAPHTSYALASLLTAKFIKPVAELSSTPRDHVTLPDQLRRYGYRTAAFYPPAIFFVDGARFAPLHERAFGFEYLKEMYATADLRVTQLEDYLRGAAAGHPLFLWVHLFEPHEPYEPSASWPHRDTARARYEGEVVDADRALGELVRVFRAHSARGTVILTADHGEEFGEHGGSFHGSTLYDEQARVPLIWSSPGVAARTSDAPVELVDIGTTLLATAFVPRDARMRGDDLSPVLVGDDRRGPVYAFASVEDRAMITDGALKAVCAASEPHCQLFDLARDPGETRSVTATRAQDAERLRGVLHAFLRSIPAAEALAMDEGVAFPEALARAELGVSEALPEVLDLLGDARASVRAKAAHLLGERVFLPAADALDVRRVNDPDPDVRAEASIAALALGRTAAREDVRAVLRREGDVARARRAALVLAQNGDLDAAEVLAALARDDTASETARLAAVDALGGLRVRSARDALIALLGEPRLGARAADALRSGGFHDAADALAEALAVQRYPAARTAQARALFALADPRAPSLTRKLLGMETSVPAGLSLLAEYGLFDTPHGDGGRMSPALRRGAWRCVDAACTPGEGARLVFTRVARGRQRLLLAVAAATPGSVLRVGEHAHGLRGGAEEINVLLDASDAPARGLPIRCDHAVALALALIVPAQPEIAPPAPEAWSDDP